MNAVISLILVLLLSGFGISIAAYGQAKLGFDSTMAGAMAGAVISSAAVVLGAFLSNWTDQKAKAHEQKGHRQKFELLLTEELVGVAISLRDAKRLILRQLSLKKADPSHIIDLTGISAVWHRTSFIDGSDENVFLLPEAQIALLLNFRRGYVQLINHFNIMTGQSYNVQKRLKMISFRMGKLANYFSKYAPNRELKLSSSNGKTVAESLRLLKACGYGENYKASNTLVTYRFISLFWDRK